MGKRLTDLPTTLAACSKTFYKRKVSSWRIGHASSAETVPNRPL